jgi:hypothetical protein
MTPAIPTRRSVLRSLSAAAPVVADADVQVGDHRGTAQIAHQTVTSPGRAGRPLLNGHSRVTSAYIERNHVRAMAVADARHALHTTGASCDPLVP